MECSRTSTRSESYSVQLRSAIRQFLPAAGLPLCSDDQRVRWSDRMLLIGLLLMVWHPASSLREAFGAMREQVIAMYPTRKRPGAHLEGFLKAWRTRSARLLKQLILALRAHTQRTAAGYWRWRGWVVLGVDGSRINCPRTLANERAFGCAGKRRTAPQQLLVTVFHVAGHMPWGWRRSRGDGSERDLLLDLLPELPERTLFLADAGLVGYRVLTRLQDGGHAFIVRVGRNVTLLRKLGDHTRERDGIVYLWPDKHQSAPPLVLRLLILQDGRQRVALLTNVLDERRISDGEMALLYRERWALEVMHRTLKQTLSKGKLRAQTPELAACELDWSMAGLWLIGLLTHNAAQPPRQISPAAALRVIRTAMRRGRRRTGKHWLRRQLRAAVPDRYRRTRPKQARDWPHKKSEPPPGTPKIRTATRTEIRKAQAWIRKNNAA